MGHGCGPLTFLLWSVLRHGRAEVLLSSRSVLVTWWPYLMRVFGDIACAQLESTAAPLESVPGGGRGWSRLAPGFFLPLGLSQAVEGLPLRSVHLPSPSSRLTCGHHVHRGSRCTVKRVNPGESPPQAWKAAHGRLSREGQS